MRIKHFKILSWLEVKNRLVVRLLDAMILELRYAHCDHHFLERGKRVPE
jgi:hypothetical protein